MIKLMPNKNTSKIALYFLTITTLIFALLYGIEAGGIDYTYSAEINSTGEPRANDSPLDEQVCGLNNVDCENDVVAQIRQIAEEEDFPWVSYAERLTYCESMHDPNATNTEGNSAGTDRGLWQINDYYHPDVSDECAYSVDCSTRWSMRKIKNGGQGIWSCDKLVKNI